MQKYLAHISDDGKEQTVFDHCSGVANLAKSYSIQKFKQLLYNIGMYHDIGKYAENFQKRLKGCKNKFEHSICGAIELQNIKYKNDVVTTLMQYCIAGHHTGLPDGGTKVDADGKTLMARLNRNIQYNGDNDYKAYSKEISIENYDFTKLNEWLKDGCDTKDDVLEKYAFLTRYAFSCLTDADYIDTEKFCQPDTDRCLKGDYRKALDILNSKLSAFKQDTKVRKSRNSLLQQAITNYDSSNIHLLNMPTGSGKTLCSLKLAFEEALKSNKKRIIYVIPYTSIIEQTANQFEKMFQDVLPVLQHHSNYSFTSNDENQTTDEKLKKVCENWDAPLIVTTSVQFFQSLYHYKSSRLRKMHNLADSIIILDEIHLIPTEYIQPCLRGIGLISKELNSQFIFLSATMPDYNILFDRYIPDCKINELIKNKTVFSDFNNCTYKSLGECSYEYIVSLAEKSVSSLIIVNKRKTARDVFNLVSGKKYHLSTYMSPYNRTKTIESIKKDLSENNKITVVSTSLIEAGVDLDFETVFRELAGLDSILQSGGRCNREGNRTDGTVYIFETDNVIRNSDMSVRINITKDLLKKYIQINFPECIQEYYSRLFAVDDDKITINSIVNYDAEGNCFEKGINKSVLLPFRSYAESFRYINSETISIIIKHNNAECLKLIEELYEGNRTVLRSLQKYSVSVYFYEFNNILKLGIIKDTGNGAYVLENMNYYDDKKGLSPELICDEDYIIGKEK